MDSQSSRSRIQHVSLDCLFFLGDHCVTPHFSFSHKKQEGKGKKKADERIHLSALLCVRGSGRTKARRSCVFAWWTETPFPFSFKIPLWLGLGDGVGSYRDIGTDCLQQLCQRSTRSIFVSWGRDGEGGNCPSLFSSSCPSLLIVFLLCRLLIAFFFSGILPDCHRAFSVAFNGKLWNVWPAFIGSLFFFVSKKI